MSAGGRPRVARSYNCSLMQEHTEVNETTLLRDHNEKGHTHKIQRKAEAAADPGLSFCCSGSPFMPSKSQSKRVGLLLLPAYQSPYSPLDHTLRAE